MVLRDATAVVVDSRGVRRGTRRPGAAHGRRVPRRAGVAIDGEVRGRLAPADAADDRVAVLAVGAPPVLLEGPGAVASSAERLRAGLRGSVDDAPADARGLLPGLVIGDTSRTPDDLTAAMRATGMTHLTAVSGSNVAVVTGMVLGLCVVLGVPRRLRPILALLALAGFVVLARPEPSVVRAAAMGAIGLIGLSRSRRSAGPPVLGAAIVVVLVLDPWLARSFGFALSSLATLGLLLFTRPWGEAIGARLPARLAPLGPALAIPVAAQAMTAPLVVVLQGSVSVVGVLANFLAAPFVPIATVAGVAAALVSVLAPGSGARGLGRGGADDRHRAGGEEVRGGPGCVAAVAGRPSGGTPARRHHDGGGPHRPCPRASSRPSPGGRRRPGAAGRRLPRSHPNGDLATGGLAARRVRCRAGRRRGAAQRRRPGGARGRRAGSAPRRPVPAAVGSDDARRRRPLALPRRPRRRPSGAAGRARRRPAPRRAVPEPATTASTVPDIARRAGIPVAVVHAGDRITAGEVDAVVWSPWRRIADGSVPNNASVVLAARTGAIDALLLGDVEQEAARDLLLRIRREPSMVLAAGRFEVVKTPHHGSANLDDELLALVRAPVGVVSVGRDNDYGHPAPRHLEVLRRNGYAVFRTDEHGDVALVELDGQVRVVTSR